MSKKIHSQDQLTLLLEDSLANLLVMPESEKAIQMTVFSGQQCAMSLKLISQLGYLVKMLLESSIWRSNKCYLIWKTLVMKHKRLLFQLVPSTPYIDEIESGL